MSIDEDFLIACGVYAAICAVVLGIGAFFSAYSCGSRAEMMKLPHRWGPVVGCMVDAGDRWSPIEYVRIVDGKVSIQGNGE